MSIAIPRFGAPDLRLRLPLLFAALCTSACAAPAGRPGQAPDAASVSFERAPAHISANGDTVRLDLEIASSPAQHEVGLMGRASLVENAGMLFVFDEEQDAESGFWMYRTRIPLDAAFMDAAGRILAIRSMTPCPHDDEDDCEKYVAGVPWRMALEVNGGFFARHGIGVGARLLLDPPRTGRE